jgi:uncharacterized membrane protein YdjX (TVP38/TMEM64 family)
MEVKMKKLFTKGYIRFIIFIILILVLIFISKTFSIDKDKIDSLLKNVPPLYSSLIFIALYVASNFFITGDPKEVLKLVAIVVFGVYLSAALIYIAEIINATVFFHLSKFLGKEFMDKYLKGRFKNFYEKLGNLNFGWICLLRLNILIPYRVLDVCFGLSKVAFKKYITAVLAVSLPRIFFLQYMVASLGEITFGKAFKTQLHPLFALLFIIYFIFSVVVIFKSKKRLW